MNIWLVNPFDPLPGEQLRAGRYAFFAKVLSENGHSVTWWTSTFSHVTKSYRSVTTWKGDLARKVQVIALPAPAYRRNVGVRRLFNHVVWARNFYNRAHETCLSPDVILASSPPLYAPNRALRLARQREAKVIIDVQDLWPEAFGVVTPSAVKWLGTVLMQPLKMLEDSNFRHANGLIAISQTLLTRALAVNPGVKAKGVIPLGVDREAYELATRHGESSWHKSDDEFWVAYVGTIGKTYDIDTILQTARLLRETEPNIKFFIVGSGPLLKASQSKTQEWGLSNVIFTGFLSLDILAQFLVKADVGLNAVASGTVSAFPNKIFDYMATGLPVVNSVKGELEQFIQQQGLGVQYEAGKPASLRKAILTLHKAPDIRKEMGMRGHKLVRVEYDRRIAYSRLPELIREVCE